MKLSHERKVRSLAKKTFGSTRVGRAILFPGFLLIPFGWGGGIEGRGSGITWGGLEERLGGHCECEVVWCGVVWRG